MLGVVSGVEVGDSGTTARLWIPALLCDLRSVPMDGPGWGYPVCLSCETGRMTALYDFSVGASTHAVPGQHLVHDLSTTFVTGVY